MYRVGSIERARCFNGWSESIHGGVLLRDVELVTTPGIAHPQQERLLAGNIADLKGGPVSLL